MNHKKRRNFELEVNSEGNKLNIEKDNHKENERGENEK